MQAFQSKSTVRDLSQRAALLCGALLTALTVAWLVERQVPVTAQIAGQMLGESWYRIEFSGQHVGYMYNHANQDHLGRWQFQTTTHFRLNDAIPTTISKDLLFGQRPPHPLQRATYTNRRAGTTETIALARNGDGYRATLSRDRHTSEVDLTWHFDLESFLSFERWLHAYRPSAGAQHPVPDLDFERLQVNFQSYRVEEKNDTGYLVSINAPLAATRTQLGSDLRPVWLNMAGVFDVFAAPQAEAIDPEKLPAQTTYAFPVDQRLQDHTQLKRLQMSVLGPAGHSIPDRLTLHDNPVTAQDAAHGHSGEELRYPISDQRIKQLAGRAIRRADVGDPIEGLVRTTFEQLAYRENQPAGSVLQAMERGYGECTDFADLFTTVARAAGFPARTVYGLAYRDGPTPAFMFHAWNEIHRAGRWQAVDPTWNQTRVDATHIPLSDTQAATMMHANNISGVRFEVIDKAYF